MIMEEYFATLNRGLDKAMSVAQAARAKGLDPEPFVEIIPAEDVAGRVEGIVGPKGIAARIREMEQEGKPREILAFDVVKEIIAKRADYGVAERERAIDQSVRTGVGIMTEGVLVAPTEGIAKIRIRKNPDGSEYLSVYFSGPIRSAGGTVAALSVVLADFARQQFGIADYRPTDTEVERYVEEVNIYDARAARLQYKPPDEDVRQIVRNCPVCIDGDPTEEFEVSVYKGLERVETDRIRGGIALVVCEGIAQKAAKVLRYTKKIGVNWAWLEGLVKIAKKEGKAEIKPNEKFLDDLVAGRPIFSYPSEKGGFRLRYGRTRMTGIAAKAIHPATMVLLDDFPAIGTQLKLERPGKGCVVTPCDSIEGPAVKLDDGSVVQVNSLEEAEMVRERVVKILFLGDILVSYGDFQKSNHPLVPGGYCEEQWLAELERAAKAKNEAPPKVDARNVSFDEAVKISQRYGIPLAPRFTCFWHDVDAQALRQLADWLATGKLSYDWFRLKEFRVEASPAKSVLEDLCVPHKIDGKFVVLEPEHAAALLSSLGMLANKAITLERFNKAWATEKTALQLVNELSGVKIKAKAPTYIGSRMGRPEKAKERLMKPAPHVLFPIGGVGGKVRSIAKAYRSSKEKERFEGKGLEVEVARLYCPNCKIVGVKYKCDVCGARAVLERVCTRCGREAQGDACPVCKGPTRAYDSRPINLAKLIDEAVARVGEMPDEVKGVIGLVSETKSPEMIDKGLLRARHGIFVFRDGTVRFDATDVPLTHFYPKEIGVSVEKLRELGYAKDADGNELKKDDQLAELRPQDVLLSDRGAEYFLRVCRFVDDLLVYVYGLPPFYNTQKREDLLGQMVITLAPHTSCGVLGRVIGFTRARVGYAHPYMIAARRRNCDGDEDSTMLLLDALINFSKKFLPEKRGGQMDASLVMTTVINPLEVDDEVHAMDICASYPAEFYELAEAFASPAEAKIEQVSGRLGKPEEYSGLRFSHSASSINAGPIETRYVKFKSMGEKVDTQFRLCSKIRAVNLKDSAERVILSHFLPDLYGNLRSFSRQTLRCVDCNSKYRRAPLSGKCDRCGGKLVLTISKGGIEKYLKISQAMVEKYDLPNYLKQRLMLLERDISSIFEDETKKQFSLEQFM